ncbi:MAG TPA: DUF721 domain-containing protein [Candidatus Hypogeohydataceae bacterium YC41]
MSKPTNIKDVLEKVLPGLKPPRGKKLEKLQEAWRKVVEERAARQSRIKQLKRGVLLVEVDSAPTMQYISERDKGHLLGKLKELVEGVFIKEIRLRLSKEG